MCTINYCNNNRCSRCGECCAFAIPITRKEEKRIREYIKANNIEKENLFDDENFYCKCCFYDRKNKKCKIYPVRPYICKSYQCNKDEKTLSTNRLSNHEKAYWNHIGADGKIKNFTSFDLLFYNDPKPILQLLCKQFVDENGNMTTNGFQKMKKMMHEVGLGELANSMQETLINEEDLS